MNRLFEATISFDAQLQDGGREGCSKRRLIRLALHGDLAVCSLMDESHPMDCKLAFIPKFLEAFLPSSACVSVGKMTTIKLLMNVSCLPHGSASQFKTLDMQVAPVSVVFT